MAVVNMSKHCFKYHTIFCVQPSSLLPFKTEKKIISGCTVDIVCIVEAVMSLPLYSSWAVCGVISHLSTDRLMDTVMCMRAIEMMVVQEED